MKYIVFLLLLCGCLSTEQKAIRKIDKHERALRALYAAWPKFAKSDSVKGETSTPNPVVLHDTTVLYKDKATIQKVYKTIYEKCGDSTLAKKISKEFENKKCIQDSIVIHDTLFKAIVTQDSLGVHVKIYPKDVQIKAKYKQACPPYKEKSFYEYNEWWYLLSLLGIVIFGFYVFLQIKRSV